MPTITKRLAQQDKLAKALTQAQGDVWETAKLLTLPTIEVARQMRRFGLRPSYYQPTKDPK